MKLQIKQRVFSWTDTYDVYDEFGEPCYYVQAEFFTFGHQIHVFDKRTGQEVGSIHQKLFRLLPEFEIVVGGRSMGTIRRELSLFLPRYRVDYCGWEVIGDCVGWEYQVCQGERPIMNVSRELFHWGDTYVLQYDDARDEIPGLLLVIAIDAANCGKD